ncbi:hypothetical protein CTA1_12509 [Colletotrichum tanaceti]|uniref:Rhodopsin domain-containing protein n=1 Tax=Colletotrichum tanaceti TaxID=1306861 RepID=A0A4U6XBP9_9PEZI|nr:hypothetical protein CTA1_12509 [Colletotrichum tanaceti]
MDRNRERQATDGFHRLASREVVARVLSVCLPVWSFGSFSRQALSCRSDGSSSTLNPLQLLHITSIAPLCYLNPQPSATPQHHAPGESPLSHRWPSRPPLPVQYQLAVMVQVDESFAARLRRQGWIHYALGIVLILLRMYGRAKRLGGVTNYQADDYLQILAAILFTLLVVSLNVITDNGGSNLYPPDQLPTFSPADVAARVAGSKLVLVSEQAMLNLIYVLKACVLLLYTRLTLGLTAQLLVRGLAVYVAVGWAATQITLFAACRPFAGYWAVPPPDPQCATYATYAVVQACFNISSDVLMLLVPLPLVLRMEVAWRQKAVLVFVFSLGICVVVAALLTKIFNLRDPYSPVYMLWYIREAGVAVYVSNLPLMWPLLRDWFPCLRGGAKATKTQPPTSTMTMTMTTQNVGRTSKTANGSSSTTSTTPTTGVMTQSFGGWKPPQGTMAATAAARRDTFDEFGSWLNVDDLELKKSSQELKKSSQELRKSSQALGWSGLGSSWSQRHMLEWDEVDDIESSPPPPGTERRRSRERRRLSLPQASAPGPAAGGEPARGEKGRT